MKLTAPTAQLSGNQISYFPYTTLGDLNNISLAQSESLRKTSNKLVFSLEKSFKQSILGHFYRLFSAPVL